MEKNNFKIGQKYYLNRGLGKQYKIHIVGIVENNMVAFKWYGRHKQYWHYEIKHFKSLKFEINLHKQD